MNKYIQRLLIFIIGIPLIILLVIFLPRYGHLALNIVVVVFSALGAVELGNMLKEKKLQISTAESAVAGALTPALMTALTGFHMNFLIIPAFLVTAIIYFLVSSIFLPSVQAENYINRITAGIAVLAYPGFFLAWICAMGNWNGILILVFLLVPLLGDSTAWAAGMLFGKNNRGIIKVSPNKSIAGFIGSIFASVLVTTAAVYLFPGLFVSRKLPVLVSGIILGLIPGICAILGDLCESAIKRSSGVKDSGGIIPGRGGVLDSVDSVALAAPSFYLIWTLLFTTT
ncbi:MAG: phosphatidate cytidylyltransferase [Treponema sp.]|nr:phosphatidate cytidylyltransferase [Treponema sp.]